MTERILTADLKKHIGREAIIAGWVDVRRDQGKMVFFDMRDVSGKVQCVVLPGNTEAIAAAKEIRPEWVLKITGKVNKRPEKNINKDQPNGDIELEILKIEVLNEAQTPPFDVRSNGHEIGEEMRLQYRYLDLRRPRLQKNILNRHRAVKFIRDFLDERGFVEIETPLLTKSTPEGARDFIVPSRIYNGKFYALPQSPQQYKQLLMVAGIERYFQIAKCLRDEDTRGDRQAEFTQLDIEMAFPEQEEILNLLEELYTSLIKKIYPNKKMTAEPWPRLSYDEAMAKYGTDKPDIRKDKNDSNELGFCWIVDFPLFEKEMENGHYAPSHHMFTMPKEEDMPKLDTDPGAARSYQHDLALNGYEIAGGSIRIHKPELQEKIFSLIGFNEKQKEYFRHMLTAFHYGVPPHGGIAAGLERFLMILEGESSIREVMAFPKTGEGRDLMMGAPSEVPPEQIKELGIQVIKGRKK